MQNFLGSPGNGPINHDAPDLEEKVRTLGQIDAVSDRFENKLMKLRSLSIRAWPKLKVIQDALHLSRSM